MKNELPKRFMTIREIAHTGILPEHTLRNLVKTDSIPYFRTGNRVLIDIDSLIDNLSLLARRNTNEQ